ncbi:glycosyltransferase family 4 protein [Tessaracoccus terricola]
MQPEPVIGYVLKMYPRFSETFVVSEILAREAQGERIVIFSLRPTTDPKFHPELARVQAPVIHVGRPTSVNRMWEQLRTGDAGFTAAVARELPELLVHPADEAAQAVEVAHQALAHGVTHLHAHFASVATTVARLAGRLSGLPYSFTAHAKDIFHDDVVEAELGRKLGEAHHAITISGYNETDLRRRFPTQSANLRLVHNGLELDRFPVRETPVRVNGQRPRLLSVGRLVEKKGFGLLIDAVAALRERGIDVECDIAGDGPLAEDLARQVAELGLQDRVRLLGPVTQAEVGRLLGSHDAFVAPFVIGADGNADGLPTVLLEAMARGIPCVAAEVTAVGEVVIDGQTGWLVPTGDLDALTDAVADAVAPGADHTEVTRRARRLVEETFDSRRQAARLRELVTTGRGQR